MEEEVKTPEATEEETTEEVAETEEQSIISILLETQKLSNKLAE